MILIDFLVVFVILNIYDLATKRIHYNKWDGVKNALWSAFVAYIVYLLSGVV